MELCLYMCPKNNNLAHYSDPSCNSMIDDFSGTGGFGVVYHADRYLAKPDGIKKDPRWPGKKKSF